MTDYCVLGTPEVASNKRGSILCPLPLFLAHYVHHVTVCMFTYWHSEETPRCLKQRSGPQVNFVP